MQSTVEIKILLADFIFFCFFFQKISRMCWSSFKFLSFIMHFGFNKPLKWTYPKQFMEKVKTVDEQVFAWFQWFKDLQAWFCVFFYIDKQQTLIHETYRGQRPFGHAGLPLIVFWFTIMSTFIILIFLTLEYLILTLFNFKDDINTNQNWIKSGQLIPKLPLLPLFRRNEAGGLGLTDA